MLIFTITEMSIIIAALYCIINNARPEIEFAINANSIQANIVIQKLLPNIYFAEGGPGPGPGPMPGPHGSFSAAGGMTQGTMYGYGAGAQDPSGGDHATNIEADKKNRELTHGKKSFFRKMADRISDFFEGGCI